jgi:hypothetical protein
VLPDGRREVVRRSDDHGYRPTTRPYFRAAAAARGLVWTEPYEFYAGGGMGITCAAPLLEGGAVRGVFTVDFSLDRLSGALEELEVSPRGRVFIATRQGALLVGRRGSGATRAEVIDAELAAATARAAPPSETAFTFEHQGARYLGRAMPLHVGDLRWLVDVVVPEGDFTDRIDAQARVFVLLGVTRCSSRWAAACCSPAGSRGPCASWPSSRGASGRASSTSPPRRAAATRSGC